MTRHNLDTFSVWGYIVFQVLPHFLRFKENDGWPFFSSGGEMSKNLVNGGGNIVLIIFIVTEKPSLGSVNKVCFVSCLRQGYYLGDVTSNNRYW